MCGILALSFIVVTATEIALLVKVGGLLGGWATFGLVIATGLVGAALARHQGAAVLAKLRDSLAGGDPTMALVDGALVLAAGVTLLSPGFLTDATGLLLLIPPIRAPVARRLHRYFAAKAKKGLESSFVVVMPDDLDVSDDEDPPPPGVIDV